MIACSCHYRVDLGDGSSIAIGLADEEMGLSVSY